MKLNVKPIYGWGWGLAGSDKTMDVPPPFTLEAEEMLSGEPFGLLLGRVETANHPLSGMWICLSPRSAPFNGDCNLAAFTEKPTEPRMAGHALSGFAMIELESPF